MLKKLFQLPKHKYYDSEHGHYDSEFDFLQKRDLHFVRLVKQDLELLIQCLILLKQWDDNSYLNVPLGNIENLRHAITATLARCRYTARGYRQCWILRHMLRIVYLIVFDIDLYNRDMNNLNSYSYIVKKKHAQIEIERDIEASAKLFYQQYLSN